MHTGDPRPSGGFSLVEMLVVLGLVTFLLAGSLLAVDGIVPRWRLQAATSEIALSLMAARSRAAVTSASVAVLFDGTTGRYGLSGPLSGAVTGNPPPLAHLPAGVRFAAPAGMPAITLSPPGSSDTAAVFTASGRLNASSLPGYVHLGDVRRSLFRRVVVSSTGRVSTERWSGVDWVAR
jgi:type II secretory pathway pseudopilin PulG